MSQLLSWREDLTFIFDVLSAVGFIVYFLFLAINGRQTLAQARVVLSSLVQPDANMSEESRAAFESNRLRVLRGYNSCVVLGTAFIRLTLLAKATTNPVRDKVEYDDGFGLPWLFAGIFFEMFPRTMTVRRFEILYIVSTSVFACERLIGCQYSPPTEVALVCFRVANSIIVCNPRLVLGMEALSTAVNIMNHMLYNPHPMYGTLAWARGAEMTVLVAITALSYYSHYCAVRIALLQSELQAALKTQAPLRSLLARWCDATVELGSDLRMRQHSVNLAALLFRTSFCLQGTLFEDLLHRTDRLRFTQIVASCLAMEGPATHATPAQVFPVSLLDGNGRPVPVQLVHTCIRDGNSDYCHFIGIREEDAEFRAECPPPAITTVDASDVAACVIGAVSDDGSQPSGIIVRGTSSLSSTGSSSGTSSGSSCTLFNIANVHMSVDVDVSSSELKIVDASKAFIELGGPETIGSSFSSWVSGHQRLLKWLQTVINSLAHNEMRPPGYTGSLRFKTPIATCRAAGVTVDVEDTRDLNETFRVRLLLHGVQKADRWEVRDRSNRRGSRTSTSL